MTSLLLSAALSTTLATPQGLPSNLSELGYISGVNASPDGQWIVFEHYKEGEGSTMVWKLEISTRKATKIGPGADPAFSPDGKLLAFTYVPKGEEDVEIFTMTLDGKNRKQVSKDKESQMDPVWAPDGKSIICVNTQDEDVLGVRLATVNVADGIVKPFLKTQTIGFNPTVSVTDKIVAFEQGYPDKDSDMISTGISLAMLDNPARSNPMFTPGGGSVYRTPKFAWNGTYMAVAEQKDQGTAILLMNLKDSKVKATVFGPFFGVESIAPLNDGQTVIASLSDKIGTTSRLALLKPGQAPVFLSGKE
jgi:hypothetical protein